MSGDDEKLSRSDREALNAVKWYINIIGGCCLIILACVAFWEFFGAMF